MNDPLERRASLIAAGASVATLLLIALVSAFPDLRVSWGIGALALIIWAALGRVQISGERLHRYWLAAGTIVAAAIALYALFPAKTHFLGDGYQNLAALADGNLHVKLTAWGEGTVRVWLARLLDVNDRAGALTVYRLIAVVSGAGFLLTAAFVAGRLFDYSRRSLVFLLGMATGAWTLLYFGYVEQYALFVSTVGVYTLVGLPALRGEISRWWTVPLMIVASLLHIFGVLLIVPTLYVIMADTAAVRRLTGLPWRTRALVAAGGGAAAIGIAAAIRGQSYFLQYSLLPVLGERLSFDGYAVVSLRHVVDLTNLLLLLVPAIPLVLLLGLIRADTDRPDRRAEEFLWLAALTSLLAPVVFDPRLGMPRDWDLFSFSAVPLTALVYLTLLRRRGIAGTVLAAGTLAIAAFALAGRVTALNVPDAGAARFRDYIMLDHQRHLRSWHHLRMFYQEQGDSAANAEAGRMWDSLYPERLVFLRGFEQRAVSMAEAEKYYRRAIELNPTYSDPWVHLGEVYVSSGLLDSAETVLNTALRLNPDEPGGWNNLGVVWLGRGRADVAAKHFERARALSPREPNAIYNLALSCFKLGKLPEFARYLEEAAALPSASAGIHVDLGDWYLRQRDMKRAGEQYGHALAKGADRATIADRVKRFPSLGQYIRREEPAKSN